LHGSRAFRWGGGDPVAGRPRGGLPLEYIPRPLSHGHPALSDWLHRRSGGHASSILEVPFTRNPAGRSIPALAGVCHGSGRRGCGSPSCFRRGI